MPKRTVKEMKQEKIATEEKIQEYKINSSINGDSKLKDAIGLIDWSEKDLRKILDVCMKFAQIISPVELHPYQIEPLRRIFESVLTNDGEEITLLMSRQIGKGQVVATAIATLLFVAPMLYEKFPEKFPYFKRGILIGVFAPTAEQCSTMHARVQSLLTSDSSIAVLEEQALKKRQDSGVIEIQGGLKKINGREEATWVSQAKFMSAAKQSKIESKSFHFIVTDESQEIDDSKLLKSISPMGAAYNATTVRTGTPTTYLCEFYNSCLRNRNRDILKKGKRCHFEYDYIVAQQYNPRYKAYISKEIERYGIQSDYFQMSYALKWLVDQGMAVTASDFNEYILAHDAKFENEPKPGYTYVAGLDLGKDQDPSILTIFKLVQVVKNAPMVKTAVKWFEFKDKLWEEQFAKIVMWLNHYNCVAVAVDSTGKGDPIAEILTRMLATSTCTLLRVHFSLKTKHTLATEFYEDLFKGLAKCVGHKSVKSSKEFQQFFVQMTSCVKTYKQGYLQLEHPKDVPNAHDDYVDSYLLGLYAARRMDSFVARQETTSLFEKANLSYDERFRTAYMSNKVKVNALFKSK